MKQAFPDASSVLVVSETAHEKRRLIKCDQPPRMLMSLFLTAVWLKGHRS